MDLLVRVRIVKSIKEGEKLVIRKGLLSVESPRFWTPIWRWIRAEDRHTTLTYLQCLVRDINDAFQEEGQEDSWQNKSLLLMLPDLSKAFERLSYTYAEDVVMVSNLEALVENLRILQKTDLQKKPAKNSNR